MSGRRAHTSGSARPLSRRGFLRGLGVGAAATLLPSCTPRPQAASGAPNILLLTGDDLHWAAPGCFGGLAPEITPNLDALAARGRRFLRAHVNISICQASRAVMFTSLYPQRNGVTGFGMPVRHGVPILSEWLAAAGYETALLGKEYHYQPIERFGFQKVVTGRDLNDGRDPAAFGSWVQLLVRLAADAGRPFFIHANSHDPHRPFHGSADERRRQATVSGYPPPSRSFEPGEVTVPGFLPDLPDVRREVAQYCSTVRRLDDMVGAVLDVLDGEGVRDDTLVIFLSDHGMSFPFAKGNCYLASTRTPLIAAWPGRIAPGSVDDLHVVSALDLMPTLLEIAVPDALSRFRGDGRSFLAPLEGRGQPGWDESYASFYETFNGDRYEMRGLRQGRWGYIWNPWADGVTEFLNASQAGLSMAAMRRAARRDRDVGARVRTFLFRKPEELYDYDRDPDALSDLADDPAHAGTLASLRERLATWMHQQDDPLSERFAEHLQGAG